MIKYSISTLMGMIILLSIASCCKEEMTPPVNPIPPEVLKQIEANGQVLHQGTNPPNINGKYLLSPAVLVRSNFDDDLFVGYTFVDNIITFSGWKKGSSDITIQVEEVDHLIGTAMGSYISGSGNDFTVYVLIDLKDNDNHTVKTTHVFSGTIIKDGINNLQLSIFMVDDNGDPNDKYIENGQGRLVEDEDGFSEKI
ncbi:MAG: hypothetical protein KDE33_24680 [Bacteroidetes bacterium]|nr:hypothetical protein [Bacteroidota bacterium]MCB0686938.1 hypothetical protein [Saprospiraceae bacterium]